MNIDLKDCLGVKLTAYEGKWWKKNGCCHLRYMTHIAVFRLTHN